MSSRISSQANPLPCRLLEGILEPSETPGHVTEQISMNELGFRCHEQSPSTFLELGHVTGAR